MIAIEQCGAGRGELDEAQLVAHLVVVFGDEARLLDVEGLGAVDVGDGDLDQLQAPVELGSGGAVGGGHLGVLPVVAEA